MEPRSDRSAARLARSLLMRVPGTADQLAGLRHALRDWLRAHQADPDLAADLVLAVGEATTNAVEHAYHGVEIPGPVTLSADIAGGGVVVVQVSDEGTWRVERHDETHRGRGLRLMRECADRLELLRSAHGTTVSLRARLH